MTIQISGSSLAKVDRTSQKYANLRETHQRIAAKDASTWGAAAETEAAVRLNWVDLPETSLNLREEVDALTSKFADYTRVILCGMGGSSLAPEVLAKTFKRELLIIDSTDPNYIEHFVAGDLSKTVIVVSSKSGSTIETASQRAFFQERIEAAGLIATNHFVFVTDPGSPLDIDTRSAGFTVINADPNVGGRYSALSAFGIVPAALAGIDMWSVISDASKAKAEFLASAQDILDVAYLFSEVAGQYLAFSDSGSGLPGLSDWIEQLIAESTGKDGNGRLPVVAENVASAAIGGAFTIAFSDAGADIDVIAPLGAHFIFWEWVTALVSAAISVDPFNQPNVTEAKEQTTALLNEWGATGDTEIPARTAQAVDGEVEIFGAGGSISEALKTAINNMKSDGYIAIMAYLDRRDDARLEELRVLLSNAAGRPVTFGWGPRFLHSTGQFHKAGQPNGTFIQITGEVSCDFQIPGRDFTFATLLTAQALGDGRALSKRGYPLLNLHLKNRSVGIDEILKAARSL